MQNLNSLPHVLFVYAVSGWLSSPSLTMLQFVLGSYVSIASLTLKMPSWQLPSLIFHTGSHAMQNWCHKLNNPDTNFTAPKLYMRAQQCVCAWCMLGSTVYVYVFSLLWWGSLIELISTWTGSMLAETLIMHHCVAANHPFYHCTWHSLNTCSCATLKQADLRLSLALFVNTISCNMTPCVWTSYHPLPYGLLWAGT